MKLSIEQIKSIAQGAVRVEEKEDGIHFYRFTREQEEVYKIFRPEMYCKTFSSSGVCVEFETNSEFFFIKTNVLKSVSRSYFSFDVFVNGKFVGSLDNFSNKELPEIYCEKEYDLGIFSKTFLLGTGIKIVRICFPWSVKTVVESFEIEDGAFIRPVKKKGKMLAYGDSITQGCDALRPSKRYPAKIAEIFEVEEVNKAIGGDVFFPELAQEKDDFIPEFITVGYGTNDWSKTTEDILRANSEKFYKALCKNYPDSPIFTILPIWRKDYCEYRKFGKFSKVEEIIKEITAQYDNITVIQGFDFVPKDETYFADRRLHPNDRGFEHYFHNLYEELKDKINIDTILNE